MIYPFYVFLYVSKFSLLIFSISLMNKILLKSFWNSSNIPVEFWNQSYTGFKMQVWDVTVFYFLCEFMYYCHYLKSSLTKLAHPTPAYSITLFTSLVTLTKIDNYLIIIFSY